MFNIHLNDDSWKYISELDIYLAETVLHTQTF